MTSKPETATTFNVRFPVEANSKNYAIESDPSTSKPETATAFNVRFPVEANSKNYAIESDPSTSKPETATTFNVRFPVKANSESNAVASDLSTSKPGKPIPRKCTRHFMDGCKHRSDEEGTEKVEQKKRHLCQLYCQNKMKCQSYEYDRKTHSCFMYPGPVERSGCESIGGPSVPKRSHCISIGCGVIIVIVSLP